MKHTSTLILSLCLLALATPAWAQSAQGEKRLKPADPQAKAAQKTKRAGAPADARKALSYDANKNGQLDADEIEKIKKDFADKKLPVALAKFDRNRNGQLDAAEVEALKKAFSAKLGAKQAKTPKPNKTKPPKPA